MKRDKWVEVHPPVMTWDRLTGTAAATRRWGEIRPGSSRLSWRERGQTGLVRTLRNPRITSHTCAFASVDPSGAADVLNFAPMSQTWGGAGPSSHRSWGGDSPWTGHAPITSWCSRRVLVCTQPGGYVCNGGNLQAGRTKPKEASIPGNYMKLKSQQETLGAWYFNFPELVWREAFLQHFSTAKITREQWNGWHWEGRFGIWRHLVVKPSYFISSAVCVGKIRTLIRGEMSCCALLF